MKKTRSLFFAGSFLVAAGIGFLSASFKLSVRKVEAQGDQLAFNDGVATLGRYPQTITDISVFSIKNYGVLNNTTGWYTYENKEYAIKTVELDTDYRENAKFNNGSFARESEYIEKAFLVEDLKWQVLSYGDGYANIISTRIIDRQIFDGSNKKDYLESSIFDFNNVTFLSSSFSKSESEYLQKFEKGEKSYYVNLPDESELTEFKDEKLAYPSDYAIASRLSGSFKSGGETYVNGPYWTKTVTVEGDRVKAFWSKQGVTNCVVSDSKIGVRPVIRVAYKGSQGGGGGTTPSDNPTTNKGGNVPLVLGITFTVLGAGGLITFFILWNKRHPNGKPAPWILASLAGSLVVSVVGISCLAGGIKGGGSGGSNCFNYGYYVQTDQYSGGGIVQVGYIAWLIKSDGTCSYCSHLKDNKTASDFSPDNYMSGTYTISGSSLTINIPVHEIKNFGTVGGTYKYTIKNCDTIYNAADSFHWVRGE